MRPGVEGDPKRIYEVHRGRIGEIVKRRERLIPAWKVRGVRAGSPTDHFSGGKKVVFL